MSLQFLATCQVQHFVGVFCPENWSSSFFPHFKWNVLGLRLESVFGFWLHVIRNTLWEKLLKILGKESDNLDTERKFFEFEQKILSTIVKTSL